MEILGGPLFAVAAAGESHGPAITTIIFGCPPGLFLSRQAIQPYLDRRRPGSNKHGTPRHEADRVIFLSGIYQADTEALLSGPTLQTNEAEQITVAATYNQGFTTGEPITALVLSAAKKSQHYDQLLGAQGEVRPGHTDLVKYHQSGGFVDGRGGGRSSYRSTISDVIGGSIARLFLAHQFGTVFLSTITQIGPLKTSSGLADYFAQIMAQANSPEIPQAGIDQVTERLAEAEIPTLDPQFAEQAAELIRQTRIEGDSLGAMVEVVALNVPPLVGEPLYHSLKLRLMGSLGGLHAAQSCEVGSGMAVVTRRGSENNDPIRADGYRRNNHGGMLGGITTGAPLICRVGFKPTASINKPQLSVTKDLTEIEFELKQGRHDPCVGIRAGVTLESRMAIELLNAVLMHQSRFVDADKFKLF